MIPLKKCNYITGDTKSVSYALTNILKFLEDDGLNPLLFCKPKRTAVNSTSLAYFIDNKIEFENIEEFKKKILDDGNLFRANLLIFDFWHLSFSSILEYKSLIDKVGIDHVILAKEFHYKTGDDINEYHIKVESKDGSSKYWITDKISGWTSDLYLLSKSYIREKKIDEVINKSSQ